MIQSAIDANEAKPPPQGWRWVSLGDVCVMITDGTHRTPSYIKRGIPFLSVRNVKESGLDFENVQYISAAEHEELIKRCHPQKGDVLYTKVGTTGIAKAVDTNVDFSIFVSVALLRPDETEVTPMYLERVLNSPACREQAEALTQGVGNQNLVIQDLKRIVFPLPPIKEQNRIVAKIQGSIKEVERARTACETRLEAAKALPQAYLCQVFESEESRKWDRRRLGELFDVQQGVAMSPYRREGISPRPFLRTLNVLWGCVDLSTLDKMDFTDEEVSRLFLKPGDLLVCEGGEVGRTAIWRGELDTCLYQNHIHRLRKINGTVVPEFYMYWMQAAFQVFKSYSGEESATTIPNLSENRLKTFLFPFPPAQVQARIATELQAKMGESERLVASIEKQLEAINALPQAILRKAFRGEL